MNYGATFAQALMVELVDRRNLTVTHLHQTLYVHN